LPSNGERRHREREDNEPNYLCSLKCLFMKLNFHFSQLNVTMELETPTEFIIESRESCEQERKKGKLLFYNRVEHAL
jgi:hypothetical protein